MSLFLLNKWSVWPFVQMDADVCFPSKLSNRSESADQTCYSRFRCTDKNPGVKPSVQCSDPQTDVRRKMDSDKESEAVWKEDEPKQEFSYSLNKNNFYFDFCSFFFERTLTFVPGGVEKKLQDRIMTSRGQRSPQHSPAELHQRRRRRKAEAQTNQSPHKLNTRVKLGLQLNQRVTSSRPPHLHLRLHLHLNNRLSSCWHLIKSEN